MRNRITLALLATATAVGLAGCGGNADGQSGNKTAAASQLNGSADAGDKRERRRDREERGEGKGDRGERKRGFARADMNGDGVVTREELGQEADQRFARLDRNGDGTLAGDEQRGRNRNGGDKAAAATTKEAYREQALKRFDRRDANKDGKLEGAELQGGGRDRNKPKRDQTMEDGSDEAL